MSSSVVVKGPVSSAFNTVLTPDALQFLGELHRKFNERRVQLLAARTRRQQDLNAGKLPVFLPETKHIREGNWKAAPVVKDLTDRRVEITGPVDRKMIINALNSGSKVFMADFEDATCPTWDNLLSGQINLRDAVNRTISFENKGKIYKLKPDNELATLMVRPRGWHLNEAHIEVDGQQTSGSLFDFGLFFYHNAKNLISRGSGPYFYLPKMESHLEARLWNDVFTYSQTRLGIPVGTIRATVLIETILAAFEMDEIIYELRQHSAGLNCGRWDYIFSFIKKFQHHQQFVLGDRADVTMTTPFLANYVKLLIHTCHKRGVHAMGGMSAFIPVNDNPQLNTVAFQKVEADKLREVQLGHDGTWVAHPGLIPLAKKVFDQHMPTPNQISKLAPCNITEKDLLDIGQRGPITRQGLSGNVDVALYYIESWLRGLGCVPLHNLMEDAATAEIARVQIWQWLQHRSTLNDGTLIDQKLIEVIFAEEMKKIQSKFGNDLDKTKFILAGRLLKDMLFSKQMPEFLTSIAYPYICTFATKSKL